MSKHAKTPTASARQQILETVAELFYREGYRAVGIDTIVARSGVAKMTLYRHFPSKDDLIVAYLEQTNSAFLQWADELVAKAGAPRQQLEALFDAVGTLATNPACYGCAFQHVAAEFPDPNHPGHRHAVAHKHAIIARLQAMAQAAGARDPQALAEQLLLLMDGAWVAARMFGAENPAAHVGAAARALIAAQLKN